MTEPVITPEEQLACELVNYIEAKPDHFGGLCYYLTNGPFSVEDAAPKERLIRGCAYSLSEVISDAGIWDSWFDAWVAPKDGPHPNRIRYAKFLLELVTDGRLVFRNHEGAWRLQW